MNYCWLETKIQKTNYNSIEQIVVELWFEESGWQSGRGVWNLVGSTIRPIFDIVHIDKSWGQAVLICFRIVEAEYFSVKVQIVLFAKFGRVQVQCVLNIRQVSLYIRISFIWKIKNLDYMYFKLIIIYYLW